MRINRFLARAGVGSRRGVEELVLSGRVRVNGETVRDLGRRIDPAGDEVRVDDRPIVLDAETVVLALHKPVGIVSSLRRQGSTRCLLDLLPRDGVPPGLFHVGRLDRDSSGLLLLTNDGRLGQAVLHPRRPVWKRYRVRTRDVIADPVLEEWRRGGLPMDDRPLAPARVDRGRDPYELVLELREGRNRQIRRMVEAAGTRVESLHRTHFGPVALGDLAVGAMRPVPPDEERDLRALAGADVDDDAAGA